MYWRSESVKGVSLMNRRRNWWILGSLGIVILGIAGLFWQLHSTTTKPPPLPYETIARMGWFQMCWEDRNCVRVEGVPCSCGDAGADYAINKLWEEPWQEFRLAKRERATGHSGSMCLAKTSDAPRCKSDVVPVCLRNRCVLRSRSTGEIWAD